MPNHLHGILFIFLNEATLVRATRRVAPTLQSESLGAIIGHFKSVVTKRFRRFPGSNDGPIWQRNDYEQIIRNERHLTAVQQYIYNNPANWADDDYFLAGRP